MNLRKHIILGLSPRGGEANQVGLRIVPEGAASIGTLTLTGNAIASEDVTIGTQVYTFEAAPAAANDVDIGADAAESINHLVRAINDDGAAGTDYGTGTIQHLEVWAREGAGDTMEVFAREIGVVGDAIATTENMTAGTWGAVTLENGVDNGTPPVDSALWLPLCYTSEALAGGLNKDRSERICARTGGASRMMRKPTVASKDPNGAVNGEIMYGAPFHLLLQMAYQGAWIPNIDVAGEDRLYVDVSQQAASIEKYFLFMNDKFENWKGAVLSQLQLAIPWGSKSTFVATFNSRDHDELDVVSLVGTGSTAAEPTNEIYAGARDFANFQLDDAGVPNMVVNQVDLSINNNQRGVNGLGSLGPTAHRFGDATIDGTMRLYLGSDAFDVYKSGIANTTRKLDFDMTDPAGNKYHFEFPKIVFGSDPASSPGRNQDVFLNAPFEVHTDVCFVSRDDA